MARFVDFLWLVPALPLVAAAVGAVVPWRCRRVASSCALLAMGAAFVLSCLALRGALAQPSSVATSNFVWLSTGGFSVSLGFLLDPLSALMLVMVTFVGALIFLFSTAYMREDGNYAKFFCYLSLFAAAMLGIVVSNSLLLTFICWELVGLASYLLIGFWFHKPAAAAAAKKAFITTRVGDLFFLLGILWLHKASGTLLFYDAGAGFLEMHGEKLAVLLPCGLGLSTAIGLLVFAGAVGKSGQFPLHVWLPDAMEGPTPVSALIHAATMVAAGVFLMARIFPMLQGEGQMAGAGGGITTLGVMAFVGALTALLGAVVAVAQNDIKRILAFSTVSQLGYMMMAIGVGAPGAAMFHLLTHAFFKALLFLGAGSVIHAAHHEQDIRQMGGLARRMKITFGTFSVGMMALAGVPFFFSGFWSKEAILHGAHAWFNQAPFYIGLVAVVLTAFYMTRLMAHVFHGTPRSHAAEHAHENGRAMTLPLATLAACAVLLGLLGTPAWPWLPEVLRGNIAAFSPGKLFDGGGLMALSTVLVALGMGASWAIYGRGQIAQTDPLAARFPRLWRALENRLYFDEIYDATFIRLNKALAVFADALDRCVLDGLVRATARLGQILGLINKDVDETLLNAGFDAGSESLRNAGNRYSRWQTGSVQGYLRALAIGFALLAIIAAL